MFLCIEEHPDNHRSSKIGLTKRINVLILPMDEKILKPKALKKGDRIQIIAPASSFDRGAFDRGVERIKSWGFEVTYREDIFSKERYLAGDDGRRAEELIEAIENPEVQGIFVARGGYGCLRLLPFLDSFIENLAQEIPAKVFLGYSDVTSLLNYFFQNLGWVTFHGPVVAKDIGDRLGDFGEKSLLKNLCQSEALGEMTFPNLMTVVPGFANGVLVGGCLSLVTRSLGTPYQIETTGRVLYLEDVGELLYSVDRMLNHCRQAGIFENVHGILFGPLKDAHHQPEEICSLLKDLLSDLQVPILFGYPSGHLYDMATIPLGIPVQIDANAKKVTFLESGVSH